MNEVCKKTMDNHFLIVGAAKCGTTSLHYYLDQHPDICMSTPKEPPFFELEYDKGISHYQETCFAARTTEKWTGESRHRNLYLPYTASRIANLFPKAPLVAILREPTSRAYSHYLHRYRQGYETLRFEEAIEDDFRRIESGEIIEGPEQMRKYGEMFRNGTSFYHRTYIDTGYYAQQLNRFLKHFDRSKILVILFEELMNDPINTTQKVLHHVDPTLPLHRFNKEPQNVKTGSSYQKVHEAIRDLSLYKKFKDTKLFVPLKKTAQMFMDFLDYKTKPGVYSPKDKTIKFLKDHYKAHNRELEKIIQRDLSHWDTY